MLKLLSEMLVPSGFRRRWRHAVCEKLHCRLLKAEKRMTLMKQKEDVLEAQIAHVKDLAAAETAALAEPVEENKIAKSEQIPRRKRKQKQSKAKRPLKVKKKKEESDKASDSVSSGEQEDSEVEESESAEDDENDSIENEVVSDEVEEGKEKVENRDEDEEGENEDTSRIVDENRDPHPDPVLRTECLYHVSCCVEPLPEELVEEKDEKEVVTGDQVETPGWRINVLTNRYQLEGTENITDEAYQKRHQKHEMEEKRRKRWDIQRMREQKVFDKLHGKENAAVCALQEDRFPKTFLPKIEDLTHVEISDSVVVTAFGQAVPHIEPSEFELPWDTGPSSSFTRKSHGGRGRQK